MCSKKIDTLVSDIYDVFLKPHTISPENLEEFKENIGKALETAIANAGVPREPTLRMSVIGKPDRQLWYELNTRDTSKVAQAGDVDVYEPNPEKYLKFLFGDIIEHLLVFLTKEAGHKITHAQEELDINGVLGHTDGVIDRVPVDIKSASKYAFAHKFKLGKLLQGDDPFGYVGQLSGYREKLLEKYPKEIDEDRVAWLVMNKETGEIHLLIADQMELINAEDRIEHLKKVLSNNTPPKEKCFDEIVEESGNRILPKNCSWCPFKDSCWSNIRKFKYTNGVKMFTHIEKLPRVEEVT